MDKTIYLCKDVYPKGKRYIDNKKIKKNIKKNRSNLSVEQVRAALLKSAMWPKDIKTITVKFLEGKQYQKAWVEKVVKEKIEPHIGISFLFSDKHLDPFLTITFNRNKGAYSYVGTECFNRRTIESMNLGWIDPPGTAYGGEFEWQGITYKIPAGEPRNQNNVGGTVIHEFCHALGLVHEHQNPHGNEIMWDREKVYDLFTGPPNNWDKAQIDHNIIDRYREEQLNATIYDPKSIMLYFYPASITTNNKGTSANYILSEMDKAFLLKMYPKLGELEEIIDENEPINVLDDLEKQPKEEETTEPIITKEQPKEIDYKTIGLIVLIIFLVGLSLGY